MNATGCLTILGVLLCLGAIPPAAGQDRFEPLLTPPPNADFSGSTLKSEEIAEQIEAQFAPPHPWYQPTFWISPQIWDGSIELGVNGNEGNATAFNFVGGFDIKRETDRATYEIDMDYAKNSSGSALIAHYAIWDQRSDWKFSDSPWSLFTQTTLRYDEFQAFDLRLNFNSGLAYRFIDTESNKLKGRFGAGVNREFGGPADEWTPEAVFGVDYERQFTERQKFKARFDYFPAWADFADYRFVADLGWEVLLDQTTNLSLKFGVIDRYDSTPNGARPNDLYYNLLLLWKL